jgi:hypothetical protein
MAKEKAKKLCKWKKDEYAEKLERLREIVAAPAYVCRKCGRAAANKRHLCKPVSLDC